MQHPMRVNGLKHNFYYFSLLKMWSIMVRNNKFGAPVEMSKNHEI